MAGFTLASFNKMVKHILRPFLIIYGLSLFAVGLVITYCIVRIISLRDTLAANKAIFSILKGWSQVTVRLLNGRPLDVTGNPAEGRYIVVANHVCYGDAVNLFSARPDYFHALGKKELVKVPLFGFLYKQVVILVDRNSPESRAESMRKMMRFLKEEGNIFIFPEGTFNETQQPLKEFYDGAFRLAITAQTPILPLVFLDANDRLHYKKWWTWWPGKNRAIYLDPVNVSGLTLEYVPKLKLQIYTLMENAIIKYRV